MVIKEREVGVQPKTETDFFKQYRGKQRFQKVKPVEGVDPAKAARLSKIFVTRGNRLKFSPKVRF